MSLATAIALFTLVVVVVLLIAFVLPGSVRKPMPKFKPRTKVDPYFTHSQRF